MNECSPSDLNTLTSTITSTMSIKNDSIDGASSISSSALMQKSTDTLVDESSLANKKVNDKINGIGMSNSITNKKNKLRRAKSIKNIQQDIKLNQQVWELAGTFA